MWSRFVRAARARDWAGSRLVINAFHRLWYDSPDAWAGNRFLGHSIAQCPFDLQLYQELLWELRPPAIVQTGVDAGGSLLYFASMLDLVGVPAIAPVIGVDIRLTPEAHAVTHPRVHLIEGDATADRTLASVRTILGDRPAMVVLDSDHRRDHVRRELDCYAGFVPVGGSLVVEDTNINGHPVYPSFGPGPLEAVRDFRRAHPQFIEDTRWRRVRFSFHQHGWLTRSR